MSRGADCVMQALAARGVSDVFALSGNQIMPLFDASLDAGIRIYHTRHEAAAAYTAEGYAQITGTCGIALVTAGAGIGNATAPLLTAQASNTPLLLLSGDSPVARDGQGAFQEMDQTALTRPLTKWSVRPTRVEALSETIHQALDVAMSGQPGPVHVSLPADLLSQDGPYVEPSKDQGQSASVDFTRLEEAVVQAERPLILLGPDLSETRAPGLAAAISNTLGVPAFAMESPRGVNDPALGAVGSALVQSDLVVLLGKPLDFTLKFGAAAPDADWIVVNADQAELARAQTNVKDRVRQMLQAPASDVAAALAKTQAQVAETGWRATVEQRLSQRAVPARSDAGIIPNDICTAVQRALDAAPSPILVCDGGEFGQWSQAGVTAPRRIINGVSGAIGGGVCYAMAARAADPTATVFAMMGDGTIGFHLSEFETAVREDLPFLAIVGNDLNWNAEHQIQLRDYGVDRVHGCHLTDARYDLAVAALGGFGAYVTEAEQLPDALAAAIASGKPACINVKMIGQPAPVVT